MANAVVQAILNATNDPRVRAAMVMGASLESGLNPNAVGDNGKSFGPYQIYTVAHPNVTASQAQDPVWATAYMLPQYQAAVGQVAPSMWQADPAKAAATAAYYAERPAVMYPESRYRSLWSNVQNALNGQAIGPITGGTVTASDPFGINSSVDNAVKSFQHGLTIFVNFALFFAATFVGGILVLIGLVLIFRETSLGGAADKISSAARVVNPARLVKG